MIDANTLTDTQLLLLTAASTNVSKNLLPYSKSMKSFGASLNRSITRLEELKLIKRDNSITLNEPALKDEKGSFTYRITAAGLKALGIETEEPMAKTTDKAAPKTMAATKKQSDGLTATQRAEAKAAANKAKSEEKDAKAAKKAADKEASDKSKADAKEAAAKAKADAKAAGATEGEGEAKSAGRRSSNNGKKLYANGETNPRRAGSFGYKSMQVILDNPGIKYEEFLKAGGRSVDLNWDIEHGNVEARF